MLNKILDILKATIIKVIVAFLLVLIIFIIYKLMLEEKIETVSSIINILAPIEAEAATPVLEETGLLNKPTYGSKYATLKIPSIDLELPIYEGEDLELLKSGIGHSPASYFPGEKGTIVLMGHNYKTFLKKLPEVKNGDEIKIETSYGDFSYKVYDSKVVGEYETDAAPIQNEEEILIIYTCWPINNIGHASERYLVYAK